MNLKDRFGFRLKLDTYLYESQFITTAHPPSWEQYKQCLKRRWPNLTTKFRLSVRPLGGLVLLAAITLLMTPLTLLKAQNQQCESLIPNNILSPGDFGNQLLGGNEFYEGLIPPWQSSHGTPSLDDGSNCAQENCCTGVYAHMYARDKNLSNLLYGEGIFYEWPLCMLQEYRLSFCYAMGINPPGAQGSAGCEDASFHVKAVQGNLVNWTGDLNYSTDFEPNVPSANQESLVDIPYATNTPWTEFVLDDITLSQDASQLWFYPSVNTADYGFSCIVIFKLDNVMLTCDTRMNVAFNSDLISSEPYIVSFTDLSDLVGEDVEAVTWRWFFGDGECSDEQHPTHEYAEPGEYEVCLEIIDSKGCTGITCGTVTVPSCACEGFLHITENTVWNSPQLITQHVVVDPGVQLDIQSTSISFLSDCKILVNRNARLNIVSSWLNGTNCGVPSDNPNPWAGIQVWGTQDAPHPVSSVVNGNLSYRNADHGIVYVSGGGLQNQYDSHGGAGAIAAGPSWPFTDMLPNGGLGSVWPNHFGGIVITDNNAKFIYCVRGIDLQRWPSYPSFGWQTASYVRNTDFLEVHGGIYNAQNGLTVSDCEFANGALTLGSRSIQTNDAKTSIVRSFFTRIDQAINAMSTYPYPMDLNIGSLDNPSAGNTFTDCHLGVYNIGVYNQRIGHNTFQRTASQNPWFSGIHIDGISAYELKENEFKDLWIGVIAQSTHENNNGTGDQNCNRYFRNEYGQLHFGDNRVQFRSEDFDDSYEADIYFDGTAGYNMNARTQGHGNDAAWNYFSPQIPWNNMRSVPFGNTFNYHYPENAPTTELIPRCAQVEYPVSPACTPSSVHKNYNSSGGSTSICGNNPNDPEFCGDEPCLRALWTAIGGLAGNIDGDDTDGLLLALTTSPGSTSTIQALLGASPYLSDVVLEAVIDAAGMSGTDQQAILVANAPLNNPVRLYAENSLSTGTLVALDTIVGPSARMVLEQELGDLYDTFWPSLRAMVFDSLSATAYPVIVALLDSFPDPETKRLRFTAEVALGMYAAAAATLATLPIAMDDWRALQTINLARMQDVHYTLDSSANQLLLDWEDDKGPNGALARSLLTILSDNIYFPDGPEPQSGLRYSQLHPGLDKLTLAKERMVLVPNPAGSMVTLTSGLETAEENGVIQIFDMHGRIVYDQKGIHPVQNINTSSLRPGIYLVMMQGNFGTEQQKLIIE